MSNRFYSWNESWINYPITCFSVQFLLLYPMFRGIHWETGQLDIFINRIRDYDKREN